MSGLSRRCASEAQPIEWRRAFGKREVETVRYLKLGEWLTQYLWHIRYTVVPKFIEKSEITTKIRRFNLSMNGVKPSKSCGAFQWFRNPSSFEAIYPLPVLFMEVIGGNFMPRLHVANKPTNTIVF